MTKESQTPKDESIAKGYLKMGDLNTLVIGAGDRGNAWMAHANTSEAGMKAIAVAEPNSERAKQYAENHSIPSDSIYSSGKDALSQGRDYDAVIIATPDTTHTDLAVLALNEGYNVLCEKPMAVTKKDCNRIVKAAEESGKVFGIGHVLRYSPMFAYVNEAVESERLGKVVSIDMNEDIAHWHFAHSYVRGNWGNSKESSPVIIAKSCHDLDIISWWAKSNPVSVSSNGGLTFFIKDNAPEGATEKCLDCKVDACLYDAGKFYLGKHTEGSGDSVRWPYSTISVDTSEEGRLKTLENTQFGNCVFGGCDNNQPDHQDVSIEFENGIYAHFGLSAFGNLSNRNFKLVFDRGELKGDLLLREDDGKITGGEITELAYTGKRDDHIINRFTMEDMNSHGGGDPILIRNFADAIREGNPALLKTSARESLQSHLIGFAAEKSRKEGRVIRL